MFGNVTPEGASLVCCLVVLEADAKPTLIARSVAKRSPELGACNLKEKFGVFFGRLSASETVWQPSCRVVVRW